MIFTAQQREHLEAKAQPVVGPFEVVAGETLLKTSKKVGEAIGVAKKAVGRDDNVQIIDTSTGEVLFDDRDPSPKQQLVKLRRRA